MPSAYCSKLCLCARSLEQFTGALRIPLSLYFCHAVFRRIFRLSIITGHHYNEGGGEREWKVVCAFFRYRPLFSLLQQTRRGTGNRFKWQNVTINKKGNSLNLDTRQNVSTTTQQDKHWTKSKYKRLTVKINIPKVYNRYRVLRTITTVSSLRLQSCPYIDSRQRYPTALSSSFPCDLSNLYTAA